MPKVNDSEDGTKSVEDINKNEDAGTTPVESSEETKVEEAKGLSLRDALEVSLEAHKEEPKEVPEKETKTRKERAPVKEAASPDALQPPAEYNAEEKADFLTLSRKGQEAQLRLDKSRKVQLSEVHRAREAAKQELAELQWSRDLVKEITPYLKSVGEKIPTHEALIRALKMRNEFENGNPEKAAAAYLEAKGRPVPKELLAEQTKEKVSEDPNSPLQKRLAALELERAQEKEVARQSEVRKIWSTFEQTKNAAGTTRFPDINNTESGLHLSGQIGALVLGVTEESKRFISNARIRIPDLTDDKLLEYAYRFCGGKVDDSNASRSDSQKQHLAKSNRAAMSVPGRGSQSSSSGPVTKFKTRREAAAAALAEIRAREED